jgi:hypothetical protein
VIAVPASRFVWEKAVRRAKLGTGQHGTSVLAGAFAFATFADADGSSIHPGVSLVADGLGVSSRTVDRALSRLRAEGFLTKVRDGNRRLGLADEYRLCLPDHATATSGERSAANVDRPTGSAVHPTAGDDHPTTVTRSPDAGVVPPDQSPTHRHQTIHTRPGAREARKPTVGGWTRAAQQAANREGVDSLDPPPAGRTRPALVESATPRPWGG